MERNVELKQIDFKNRTCYQFGGIIKIDDFDLGNILMDEKSYKIFQFITLCTKVQLILNLYVLDLIKQMDLLEFMMELDI